MINRNTRGLTLIEVLIAIVIASVIAGSLLRMVLVDVHFADDREAWRTARQAARSGMVVLLSDLRMVETSGGVEAAAAGGQDLTVRVPYAFGVLCTTTGASSVVSLIPVDSAMFVQPGHSGFAWRDEATEAYTYVAGGTVTGGASSGTCTGAGITVLPSSRLVTLSGTVPPTLPAGTIVFLYRRIRYEIKTSVSMPSEVALWRTLVNTGTGEEISAPFMPASRFLFYLDTATPSQAAVPSPLSSIVGLELAFGGRSDQTPRGESGPKIVSFTTSVYFHNQAP